MDPKFLAQSLFVVSLQNTRGEKTVNNCLESSLSQLPGFAQPKISRKCSAKFSAHSNTRASEFRTKRQSFEVEVLLTLGSQQQGQLEAYKKDLKRYPGAN